MIRLELSSGDWHQQLQLGQDDSAQPSLDPMDQVLPPVEPQHQRFQAHWLVDTYRLKRDIRPRSQAELSWQMELTAVDPVSIRLEGSLLLQQKELIIIDRGLEKVVAEGEPIQLSGGDRQLTVRLRPLPQESKLWQNYPNPFNPETWIPFELNQAAEVRITIYDTSGKLVQSLKMGSLRAGNYSSPERAAHWDGKSMTGEAVAKFLRFRGCGRG